MIEVDTREDGLWTLRLNRPDKANALTADMLEQLIEGIGQASAARALILTGAGKVFSAGADLEEACAGLATSPLWEEVSGALAALPCRRPKCSIRSCVLDICRSPRMWCECAL
jgi:enoyl-CoA hydratase/carnithine racemase